MAEVQPGETIVVNGASGGGGVAALICCKLLGAGKIIAIARKKERLQRVTELVDPNLIEAVTADEDIHGRIMELTEGKGANVLIDYVPQGVRTTQQCIYSLRSGGRVVLVGGCTEELPVSYRVLMSKEIQIRGAHYTPNDFTDAISLIARGAIDVSNLVTHRFPLEEINTGLDVLQSGRGNPVWIVVEP